MYDVDGNGVIDIQEMTKIVQVSLERVVWFFFMTFIINNGKDNFPKKNQSKKITKINFNIPQINTSQAIYDMLGACSSNKPADSAEDRAKNIFAKMDENNDGQLTQDEFLKGCLQDEELSKMLAP